MASMAPDYVVEVRDVNLQRLGQIEPEFWDIQFTEVFRSVGAWQLKLPAEHPLLPALKTKGAGIVITQRASGRVYSGRMQSCVLSQDESDPAGTWLVSGVDDNVIGGAALVLPDPAHAADAQTAGYWNATGDGETVMKSAVSLNVGAGAIAARKYSWLAIATNLHRGSAVSCSSRFDKLGDLLTSLGIAAGLGWRFFQVADSIVFDVFVPSDKTELVQLDIRNGGLESTELGFASPSATEVLVLGQGEGADRTVRRVTSAGSIAEAAAWGLRWESAKDQRNTDDPVELQQAGEEILSGSGATTFSLKVVPSDSPGQKLGTDWDLGDQVTVVIDDQPAEALVTEVATSITSAGLIRTATVGDPVGFDWEAKVSSRVREHDTRISNLETLVDSGFSWNSIDGKPTTFPSSWSTIAGRPLGIGPDVGDIKATALPTAPAGWVFARGQALSNTAYQALHDALITSMGTVTISIASPAVVTKTAHGLKVNDRVYLTSTGALPGGVTPYGGYWVSATGFTANSFQLSIVKDGTSASSVTSIGTQSGVHTLWHAPYGISGSGSFLVPDYSGKTLLGFSATDTDFEVLGIDRGAKTHTHTEGDLRAAIGAVNGNQAALGYQASSLSPRGPTTVSSYWGALSGMGNTALVSFNHHTPVYGTTAASSSLPPVAVVNYLIYAGV